MKTTSTASAVALSGLLLGLPMAQGREGGGIKMTLDGDGVGFGKPSETSISVGKDGHMFGAADVGQMAPPNAGAGDFDLTQADPMSDLSEQLRGPDIDMTKSEEVARGKKISAATPEDDPLQFGAAPMKEVLEVEGTGTAVRAEDTRAVSALDLLRNGADNPGQGGDNPGQGGGDPPGQGGDNPGQGGDPPGQGGDNPGQGGSDEGEADLKEIHFYCDLKIDFFEGKGREPTEDEVDMLIDSTDAWLSEVFEIDPTFVDITNEVSNTVYDETEPDYFYVEFSSEVWADHSESELWKLNIENIAGMVDHADYELYITHFIWEAGEVYESMEDFEFYHTQQVTLGCWHGIRPVATERRRLRGVETPTTFGGSHKVVREH